jgi:hypothetical protein
VHPTASPDTDLFIPLPEGEEWDPHTVHTHYFAFSIPEEAIGAFIYIRYQPAFALCGAGVLIHRGMDSASWLDAEFHDYEVTMPWPEIVGQKITTANGLSIEFLTPGEQARLTYDSGDGCASFDILQTAVTPLVARDHIMPSEKDPNAAATRYAGGSEQFMHCTGTLTLYGRQYQIDCLPARDRTWCQTRKEGRTFVVTPPVAFTPMYFGDDLAFNAFCFEPLDTDPAWAGLYPTIGPEKRSHECAWIQVDGELRDVSWVRRNVVQYHPTKHLAIEQEIDAEDETGRIHRFKGEAISTSPVFGWPNLMSHDAVYRWESEDGRIYHGPYQEMWFDSYQRAMTARARGAGPNGIGKA